MTQLSNSTAGFCVQQAGFVSYLNVEVLSERGVVDSGMVHDAEPVPFAALACPHLAGPRLRPPSTPLSMISGTNRVERIWSYTTVWTGTSLAEGCEDALLLQGEQDWDSQDANTQHSSTAAECYSLVQGMSPGCRWSPPTVAAATLP